MDDKPKRDKKPDYIGAFGLLAGYFGLPFGIINLLLWEYMGGRNLSDPLGKFNFILAVVCTAFGLIGLCITICKSNKVKKQKALEIEAEEKRRKQEEEREKAEADRRLKIIAEGKWNFPAEKMETLYLECRKGGVTSLSTAYAKEKARIVVLAILDEEGIFEEYRSLYSSDQQIEEYFEQGKIAAEKRENTPCESNLTESERQQIAEAQELANLFGKEKRITIVRKDIDEIRRQIANREQSARSMQDLGVRIASSAANAPKKDWATLGGAASGIAGSGAGVVTALNAMADNARIDRHIADANRIGAELWHSSYEKLDSIKELQDKLNALFTVENDLKNKVVLTDIEKVELFQALKLTSEKVTKTKGNALTITATVTNYYHPNVPNTVKMTTDGTLTADIYCGEISVGTAILPLPAFGIRCGGSAEITGICSSYLQGYRQYTIKLRPNKLWVMEV